MNYKHLHVLICIVFSMLMISCGHSDPAPTTELTQSEEAQVIDLDAENQERKKELTDILSYIEPDIITSPCFEQIYSALCHSEFPNLSFKSSSEHSPSVSARKDDTIYQLKNNNICLFEINNGHINRKNTFQVGYGWKEEYQDESWCGQEKVPYEIYISGDRLAVISEFFEYSTYTENDQWEFTDSSHLIIDIYDISDNYIPKLITSYGQDGEIREATVFGDDLILLSAAVLDPAPDSPDQTTGLLPYYYNGEHKTQITTSNAYLMGDQANNDCLLLARYDLFLGTLKKCDAIIGNDCSYIWSNSCISIFKTKEIQIDSEPYQYEGSIKTDTINAQYSDLLFISFEKNESDVLTVPGIVECQSFHNGILQLALNTSTQYHSYWLSEEKKGSGVIRYDMTSLSILETEFFDYPIEKNVAANDSFLIFLNNDYYYFKFGTALNKANTIRFISDPIWLKSTVFGLFSLEYTEDSRNIFLRLYTENNNVKRSASELVIGYDFLTTTQYPDSCYWDENTHTVFLLAEDSYAMYSCRENTIQHEADIFTSHPSNELRVYLSNDFAYFVDASRILSVNLLDYSIKQER